MRNIFDFKRYGADGVSAKQRDPDFWFARAPIEGLRLENILLVCKGGGTEEQAGKMPPELNTGYPEPHGVMPGYGVFARHVQGL